MGNNSSSDKVANAIGVSQEELQKIESNLNLDKKTIKDILEGFKKKSKDGKLQKDDYKKIMKTVLTDQGKELNDKFLDYYFTAFDKDNNNFIDVREFIINLNFFFSKPTMEEQLEIAFRCWDQNGDGFVSVQELGEILRAHTLIKKQKGSKIKNATLSTEETTTLDKEAIEIFNSIDTNNDGLVSYNEFVLAFISGPNQIRERMNQFIIVPY